ncbi:MAG: hypothetical protein IPK26_11575 [Planctomycetes bacterium]|nr:hypothetical protein [Planctomycetota bacterium]
MVEIVHPTTFSSVETAKAQMEADHPGSYTAPWWGDKATEHINNRGFVIGFQDTSKAARWRLDYDPQKGLHINWVQDIKGSDQAKECYKISSIRAETTMQDYMIGWTKSRHDDIPADIKQRLGADKQWRGAYWA